MKQVKNSYGYLVIHHIQSAYKLFLSVDVPIVIFKDNVVCIVTKALTTYVTKVLLHSWDTTNKKIDIKEVHSINNFADIITKALTTSIFEKIEMRHSNKLLSWSLGRAPIERSTHQGEHYLTSEGLLHLN